MDKFDMTMPFAGNPLRRHSEHRPDADGVARAKADEATRLVVFFKGNPLFVDGALQYLAPASLGDIGPIPPWVFLGVNANGDARFAVDVSEAAGAVAEAFGDLDTAFASLRDIAPRLSPEDLAIAGQARWLLDWHRRHLFCANCGAQTTPDASGAKRQCLACDRDHFPRTDPVAIILVHDDERCLLGRSPRFPPGLFSCLAGFIEPGETPEECAIREIAEEVGITVRNPRYRFSQPWPFPASLMMGLSAQAISFDLRLDETEVCEARWFSRGELTAILDRTKAAPPDIFVPPAMAIAHHLMRDWLEE